MTTRGQAVLFTHEGVLGEGAQQRVGDVALGFPICLTHQILCSLVFHVQGRGAREVLAGQSTGRLGNGQGHVESFVDGVGAGHELTVGGWARD